MRSSNRNHLFVFAHQDDEFGVFAEIERLTSAGELVHVAYLTTGTLDALPSQKRRAESVQVLTMLGVAKDNIHFIGDDLGVPDGRLFSKVREVDTALKSLVKQLGPLRTLYTLAWEGGHQDHDIAHCLSLAATKDKQVGSLVQFSLYHGANLPGPLFKLCSPLTANGDAHGYQISGLARLAYLRYVFHYPSQWRSWLGLFPFFVFHYIFNGRQEFQPVRLERIFERPHPGRLLYERRGFASFSDVEGGRNALFPTPDHLH